MTSLFEHFCANAWDMAPHVGPSQLMMLLLLTTHGGCEHVDLGTGFHLFALKLGHLLLSRSQF